jgi:hypothetical protein
MSPIEMDEELNQCHRRFLGTKAGTKKIHALVAALIVAAALPGCATFPQSSNPTADQRITADVEAGFKQHAELETPDLIDVQTD